MLRTALASVPSTTAAFRHLAGNPLQTAVLAWLLLTTLHVCGKEGLQCQRDFQSANQVERCEIQCRALHKPE
ncbi:hypothetical protein WJX84_007384 [Apatococcus fuscideae]|uniref:Uncharacterized protein n=1 Tax=Apatococcus fuscideae TaxID=2026836 RepID=A0AAW1SIA0_9CHLO